MNYLIDGHNLIGKVASLDLSMADDELRLIELLNQFGQYNRGKMEVYFDGAPANQAGSQNFGRVKAYFVPQWQTADQAISTRLAKLGKSARNWVVVSSDRSVQAAALEARAGAMHSEEFAKQIQTRLAAKDGNETATTEEALSEHEVNEWLAIFKKRGNQK
jgi:predicted RNA-binding protein with PIN domain